MSMHRRLRSRRALALLALAGAAAPIAALGLPFAASATAPLDVYAVKGAATAVRVTVQTGYSFVVEPDAMLPRAAATIQADQVDAVASPLDPGDSVDALPGVGVPTAEQDIKQGASTPFPAQIPAPSPLNLKVPKPLGGATPPPQFTNAVDTQVNTFASVFNPILTAPYEHVEATYPNPTGSGPQRLTFPPGSGDNVPPDLPDMLGLISVHSSSGSAFAGPGSGVADAGIGSAVSIPALGLTVGRTSAHVEVSGGGTAPAVSKVVTMLHDVELRVPSVPGGVRLPVPAPAGTELLHIGVLVLAVTTERAPGAAAATSHTDLEASGVTVMGQAARLDQNGLSLLGKPSALNGLVGQLIGALSSPRCMPNPPISVPNGPTLPVAQPVLSIGPPLLRDQLTHNGNERTVSMSALTLCLAGIAPVPNASSQPLSPTPTVFTITLGTADSSAYGITLPSEASLNLVPGAPVLPETGLAPSGGVDNLMTTLPGTPGTAGSAGTAGGGAVPASSGLAALLTGGILSPAVVVTLATMAELAVLATLWAAYRRAAPRRDDASTDISPMDLV